MNKDVYNNHNWTNDKRDPAIQYSQELWLQWRSLKSRGFTKIVLDSVVLCDGFYQISRQVSIWSGEVVQNTKLKANS